MLIELHIENLGVIERLSLVLGPGLIALTGETGAGKTMLVDAIKLLIGGRADSSVVRHGAAEARVDGRFANRDGVETVLSRVVPVDGRSRAYVDGRLATADSLANIAGRMVELHGQHAHQTLLGVATQRAALDSFGDVDLEPLRAARARITEIDAALATLGGDARARAREIDLLRFQIDELDAANVVDADEDHQLDAEESVLADAHAHREAGGAAHEALAYDGGARDAVAAALTAIEGRVPFDGIAERLHTLLAELDDLVAALRYSADQIEESPERLDEVRNRRQVLVDLRRKYGHDLADVMEFHRQVADRLGELESYDERAAELDAQRAAALKDERMASEAVAQARRIAAGPLASAVQERLRTLAMPHAEVAIAVGEHAEDHPADRVQLLLAANPGTPLAPLQRVASGGELARAMLALRLVLSGVDASSTEGADSLVFDEVDAGIGGAAAQAVAVALADLGRDHQVLVVTHLPQVAAAATSQVHVSKTVVGDATFASAKMLTPDERVDEVARMLSGQPTESARQHAAELLAESHP